MNAVATPPKARNAAKATAAPAKTFDAREAWKNIGKMLDAAYQTDETHERSGESDRLLRIASQLASNAAAPDFFEELVAEANIGDEMAHYAFDVAALINAARLVPGDKESTIRRGYIDAAARLLHHLAGAESVEAMIFTNVQRPAAPDPRPITSDTELPEGGKVAETMMARVTYDIAGMSEAVAGLAEEIDDQNHAALARCYGLRIGALNSVLMSYLSGDSITLLDAHQQLYGNGSFLPEGELKP